MVSPGGSWQGHKVHMPPRLTFPWGGECRGWGKLVGVCGGRDGSVGGGDKGDWVKGVFEEGVAV